MRPQVSCSTNLRRPSRLSHQSQSPSLNSCRWKGATVVGQVGSPVPQQLQEVASRRAIRQRLNCLSFSLSATSSQRSPGLHVRDDPPEREELPPKPRPMPMGRPGSQEWYVPYPPHPDPRDVTMNSIARFIRSDNLRGPHSQSRRFNGRWGWWERRDVDENGNAIRDGLPLVLHPSHLERFCIRFTAGHVIPMTRSPVRNDQEAPGLIDQLARLRRCERYNHRVTTSCDRSASVSIQPPMRTLRGLAFEITGAHVNR
jgi:hypothetical protein